jgi:hypothetical protein
MQSTQVGNLFDRELVLKPRIKKGTIWLNGATSTDSCPSCAPRKPQIIWTWNKDVQKPFEDLKDISDYWQIQPSNCLERSRKAAQTSNESGRVVH